MIGGMVRRNRPLKTHNKRNRFNSEDKNGKRPATRSMQGEIPCPPYRITGTQLTTNDASCGAAVKHGVAFLKSIRTALLSVVFPPIRAVLLIRQYFEKGSGESGLVKGCCTQTFSKLFPVANG